MANAYTERNRQSLAELREVVGQLTDDQLRRNLDADWTVAASLAHVAFWDRRAARILPRLIEGEGLDRAATDVDVLNDALLPQWRLLAPRDAVTDLIAAGTEIDDMVAALDDATAQRIAGLRIIALDRAGHRTEHLEQITNLFA